jgi:capsular polysaccharide biosynthesis protein
MEEDTVELIDYLRVIWKRKILIIVGTLACIVAGVTVSLRLPEICRAEVLVRIGKTVNAGSVSPSFGFIDTLENIVRTIPAEYALDDEGASKYDLDVNVVNGTSLIKITLEGPVMRKAKELLGNVIEKLIAYHLEMAEISIQLYKTHIEKRKTYISEIQDGIAQEELVLKEMNIDMDGEKADPFTLMMARSRMKQSSSHIRTIRDEIFRYQLIIDDLERNRTKLIGETKEVVIRTNKRRNVLMVGFVGLAMSLSLAFIIEYLGKVGDKKKYGNR